jgi:putative transcriptional regulator
MTDIIAKIRKTDRRLVRVHPEGREELLRAQPIRPMTEGEVEADARPMELIDSGAARRVPRLKTLRRALALTQEEFAACYHIPLGTLRDWEQGRSEPDQPARAYLRVIACDPEGVRKALRVKVELL